MTDHTIEQPEISFRQRFLEALLESATDYAIIAMDLDGLVTIWNEGAHRLLGWTEAEILGLPASVFFTMEDRRKGIPQAEMQSALTSGRGNDERWHLRKDNTIFWANGEMMPLKDETGTVQGFLKILRDRTEQRRAAEAQRADAEFMRGVLAASGDAITVLDLDARLVFMSEGGQRALELTDINAIIGRSWPEFWPAEAHAAAEAAVAAAKAGGTGHFQAPRDTFAGNPRWWDVRVTPMLGADGTPEKLLSVSRDITDIKLAEQRQALSEERLNLALTAAGTIGIWDGDLKAGRIFGDANFARLYGVDPAVAANGVPPGSYFEMIHPDDVAAAREEMRRHYEGSEEYANEHRIILPDGSVRWVLARGRLVRDPDGTPSRFPGASVDITDRKRAEHAMQESESRFRTLAQSMPNHIWTADASGALDWFNDVVYAYCGSAPGTLDGDGWAVLVHPDDIGATAKRWEEAQARGTPYQTEFRLRRHDGAYRWHIARAVPVRDAAGAVQRWVGSNTDIDDQKTAEATLANLAVTLEQRVSARTAELVKTQDALRQSQKMEAIGNLTGGVAHDFNNLLQVISGNLQLLSRDVLGNDRAERRVHDAMAGVQRGARLASQLLAFGRRQPLAPKVVNLGRLIRNMDDILRRTLGEGIEMETIAAGGLWNTLIDPGNVENALLNLAINARDAMSGQGRLTIEAGNAFLDDAYAASNDEVVAGQYVELAVTDTGCGIAPEILAEVFEPFFTTKPEGMGSGLGLSMVYGFVKQSGGHIKIYSEVGHGTTIRMYLPRSTESEDLLVDVESHPVIGGSETILVAEDDEPVREAVIAMLNDLGYGVLKAKDAQSALSIIESGVPIDLLFTDVVMPGPLKSTELARKARERLPGIGVLFTSGYTDNAIVHGGRLDSNVELISKPYTRAALARKLRHVLANRSQRNLDPPPPEPPADTPDDGAPDGGLMFLVVEDDWLIREITVDMLRDLGHRTVEAPDAKSALAVLAEQPVDVLVTDVGLSDMSGVTLAEHARAARPNLPIIFATGHSDIEGVTQGPSVRIITKPYTSAAFAAVVEAIATWIAGSRLG